MTLGDLLSRTAAKTPDKPALICGEESLTYRAFDEQTARFADGLRAHGIEKGDRVALHMTNTIPLAVSYFGCFRTGVIAVPVKAVRRFGPLNGIVCHIQRVMDGVLAAKASIRT